MDQTPPTATTRFLRDPDATDRLALLLSRHLGPGDTVLLEGDIGAGKTHLARKLIQSLLSAAGKNEDVPSPTYTLVQTYDVGTFEIVHADLYRLIDPEAVLELGLEEAFGHALCLVEWPDRLGSRAPHEALSITLTPEACGRRARVAGTEKHASLIRDISKAFPCD